MLNIKRVIAFFRTMMGGATPTHNAGRVHQEHTTQAGKVTSASDIKLQLPFPSPAQAPSLKKQKAAKRTTAVLKNTSKKQKPVQTGKSQSIRGNSTQTPVSKTLSPAPTQHKQKQEAVQPTTVAPKSGKKKPTVRQVAMVSQSKQTGSKSKTPASKTHQHVK